VSFVLVVCVCVCVCACVCVQMPVLVCKYFVNPFVNPLSVSCCLMQVCAVCASSFLLTSRDAVDGGSFPRRPTTDQRPSRLALTKGKGKKRQRYIRTNLKRHI